MSGEPLAVRALSVRFGGLAALEGVEFGVAAGGVHGLIGPNGAGKSTLVNALTGAVRLSGGSVTLGEIRIDGLPTHDVARAGVARTFQNVCLFAGMTVLENALVGAHRRFASSAFALLRRSRAARAEERAAVDDARRELAFVGLEGQEDRSATGLPYGHQRRLEIARALLLRPRLLLLDEPMAGMNSAEKDEIGALIQSVRDRGVTILLIEHDMQIVRRLCPRLTVLHHGEVLADGPAAEIFADEAVRRAYLGRAA